MHGGDHGEHGGQPNHAILYGIIGVLGGILIGLWGGGYSVNNQATGMMRVMGVSGSMMDMMGSSGMMGGSSMMGSSSGMGMSMNSMMNQMSVVTGTERDEQFLRMMIVHHQGAIAMAESVKETTERQELKDMADAIISAQSAEIDQLQQWLKDWFNVDVSLDESAHPLDSFDSAQDRSARGKHAAHHS